MMPVTVNDRWPLWTTYHRAARWLADPGYERARLAAMHLHIRPTDLIFDVGTEQGDISALLASWVPDGGIVCIEPASDVWPSIKATFEANNLPVPAGTVPAFCAAHPTGVKLLHGRWPDEIVGELVPTVGYATYTPGAPSTSIDELTDHYGPPNIITLDVEGSEGEVLAGAESTLIRRIPDHIFVSVHPQFGDRGHQVGGVYDLLEASGYRLWHLGDDHERHIHAERR